MKDTHFIIKNGRWSCDRHYGYRDGSDQLSHRQRTKVFQTIKWHLQSWAPALPSHVVGYSAKEVLDFLFVTGKFTMDEVKEACACGDVGDAIGSALAALCQAPSAPPPAPVVVTPAQVPATLTSLRVGDVIQSGGYRYVVCDRGVGEYMWQSDREHDPVFSGQYDPSIETFVGHVADMLAEGLAALHGAPLSRQSHGPVLGYDGDGKPVRVGNVLHSRPDLDVTRHFLVTGPAEPDANGPCVFFKQLTGPAVSWLYISLQPPNRWLCEPASPPEHMLPPIDQIVPSRRDREPVDTASLFSLD
jgi:hypothetical protein